MNGNQKGEGLTSWIAAITGVAVGFIGAVVYVHQNFVSADDLTNSLEDSIEAHTNQADHGNVNISVPSGAVVAFELEECPDDTWTEYKAAHGRFIRGIDRSGTKIDPDLDREIGSLQEDTFKRHSHTANGVAGDRKHGADGSGERVNNAATVTTSTTGDEETRPKNVALLYCQKV